jgi:hypothetical protein
MALCINTPAHLCEQLQLLGMTTPYNVKLLVIYLGKTIESTVTDKLTKLEPKLIKRRIQATTPLLMCYTEPPSSTLSSFQSTIMALWCCLWSIST